MSIITSNPTIIPSTSTSIPTTNSLAAEQFDKFFQSCSIVALKKYSQNIGIVSCQYSSNVYINKISDFIYLNRPNPSIIIVPLFHSGRISLAVFFVADKRVAYYDSLKQIPIYSLSFAKTAIEKYIKASFDLVNQEQINSTINYNSIPELANFHICRIVEEICFNGRNQKLLPFDITLESHRIKGIIKLVTNKNWKGEWIENLNNNNNNQRIELLNQSNPSGRNGGNIVGDEISALASIVEAFHGNVAERSRNVIVNHNINTIPLTSRSLSSDKDKNKNTGQQQIIFQVVDKMSKITQNSMLDFDIKYPVIAKMLNCNLNFTKRRNDRYSRSEKSCTIQKIFNWKIYTQMDHTDMEEALAVLAGFPFFAELSEIDKMALFNRFWMPFSLLERIYDTLNTLDSASTMDGDFIVLQNGSVFDLNGLLKASNPTILEKTAFEAWHMLVPLMKKIEPHCLEVMYIFCCILWNTSYLDSPISKDGEEVIRRGRLIIHKEMREFYDYDEIQWERIYALRHVLIQTEKCVEEYKKAN